MTMNETAQSSTRFGVEERVLTIALATNVAALWRHLTEREIVNRHEGERAAHEAADIAVALRSLADVPADSD